MALRHRFSLRFSCVSVTDFLPPARSPHFPCVWGLGRSRASHTPSRLADPCGRNGFVILRTGGSPSVALHPALRQRSYFRFRAGSVCPERTCTSRTLRPRRRTRSPLLRAKSAEGRWWALRPRSSGGPDSYRKERVTHRGPETKLHAEPPRAAPGLPSRFERSTVYQAPTLGGGL
jgi:hypothetical protein